MAAKFSLDGAMIPRTVKRMLDERSEDRLPASSATGAMQFRGRRHVVRLVNTSRSGAMVIFPLVPHIGEQVSLQLLGKGNVSATVRWVRDGRVGVSFDDPLKQAGVVEMNFSMIKARIAGAEDASDRRSASRFSVELAAKVRELGTTGIDARLVNISATGFMAQSEGSFEVGTRVWLMLPGRERANAVVKWTAGDKLGAEFAEAISLDGLAANQSLLRFDPTG